MSAPISAGFVAWRRGPSGPEILLVHPGGPYWRDKEEAAWSIPKGLAEPGEDLIAAAHREFAEELGLSVDGPLAPLTPCRLPGGKVVHAWLIEVDLDLSDLRSNLFEIEWPPRSGRTQAFPEVDRAAYFDAEAALLKAHKGQRPLVAEAFARIAERSVLPQEGGPTPPAAAGACRCAGSRRSTRKRSARAKRGR